MSSKRVVIADDDQSLTAAFSRRFASMGVSTETASTGIQAIARIRLNPPDLIILDVSMPAGAGLDMCKALAGDEVLSRIPIIVLTGHSDTATINQCRLLGAHYVFKSTNAWDNVRPLAQSLLGIANTATDSVHSGGSLEAVSGQNRSS